MFQVHWDFIYFYYYFYFIWCASVSYIMSYNCLFFIIISLISIWFNMVHQFVLFI